MNYIGSKIRLSNWIASVITDRVSEELHTLTFCDLFAGTGIIGRTFKTKVHTLISNDVEYYSYVLLKNYVGNHRPLPQKEKFIDELNNLKGIKGFIAEEYGENGRAGRLFFSQANAEKIDACRKQIEDWKQASDIDEELYYFLLASLLESADKVANTASVYGAYLKKLKKTALQDLKIIPATYDLTQNPHQVYNCDANQLITEIEGDILYLDPPYNARQYGANYHLLNTIAEYQTFIPKGKTGLPDYYRSSYCRKNEVESEFEELIKKANFSYIFLSYNNEGLMSSKRIKEIMQRYGDYHLETTNYQRFKADKTENRKHKASETTEFLHCLKKKK